MAITKMLSINETKGGSLSRHLKKAIHYILNPEKTNNGYLVGGNCKIDDPYETMMNTKKRFQKEWGRQGYHFVLSFPPGEVNDGVAFNITNEFVEAYLKDNYDVVFAIHNDQPHKHGHIIFNSIDRKYGYKYHYKKGDWRQFIQPIVNELCQKYGISYINLGDMESQNKSYDQWKMDKKRQPNWNVIIRNDIDLAVEQAQSYEDILSFLKEQMHYVIREGKSQKYGDYISLQPPGKPRAARNYTLGKNYSIDSLKKRACGLEWIDNEPIQYWKHSPKIKKGKQYKLTRVRPQWNQMSEYQRAYLKKMYMARRIYSSAAEQKYQESWKYKGDIVAIRKLQREFLYMYKKNLSTKEEVINRSASLKEDNIQCDKVKKEIFYKYRLEKKKFIVLEAYLSLKSKYEESHIPEKKEELKENMEKIEKNYNIAELKESYDTYKKEVDKIRVHKRENYQDIKKLESILKRRLDTVARKSPKREKKMLHEEKTKRSL